MAKSGASKGAKKTAPTGSVNIASANYFGVPKDVREANKRLSGPGPHDINDSKKVIQYYKNKKGKA
tara:strand:+ start:18323 stop:18520 length:198 start_codon:yes stop_codon:yes gene_type:complete